MKSFFLFLLLGLSACATEQVQNIEKQPNVNFQAYKTYNFMDVTARNDAAFPGPGPGVETLKRAIGREMQRRGYQPSASPDLLVNIGIMTQDKLQTRETTLREAPIYIGQRNYHWQSQDVVVGHYEEGTATVEIVDAARNNLIWQGSVKSIFTPDADKFTKRLDSAVEALFEEYPVAPVQ